MTIFLYGEVDLPLIPESLITQEILDSFPNEVYVHNTGYDRVYRKNNRLLKNASYIKKNITSAPLQQWLSEQIPLYVRDTDATVQISQPAGTDTDTTHIVHTDQRRKFALNYFLSTGGDSVVTEFYRETNASICRGIKPSGYLTDTGFVDYENLEILDSPKFITQRWYLIATNVLHGVDHIDHPRISISLPYFDARVMQEFKNKNLFKTIMEIEDDPR